MPVVRLGDTKYEDNQAISVISGGNTDHDRSVRLYE